MVGENSCNQLARVPDRSLGAAERDGNSGFRSTAYRFSQPSRLEHYVQCNGRRCPEPILRFAVDRPAPGRYQSESIKQGRAARHEDAHDDL
jgi:hypothetical protein